MKLSNILMVFLLCGISISTFGQKNQPVKISQEEAKIHVNNTEISTYSIEISGPNNYYWQEQIDAVESISISNQKADGTLFPDGKYTMQITPIYQLSEEQKTFLNSLRARNDFAAIKAYRAKENLPDNASGILTNFTIVEGKFIPNLRSEKDLTAYSTIRNFGSPFNQSLASIDPSIYYSSVDYKTATLRSSASFGSTLVDQVILDDLIVDGSACIGQDCVNGESFGFDTQRLKENNLRIHFDDTSSSASFPANDWRLVANDSGNGGASHFSIEDATAGTTPFRVMAGAGNNAIYVSNSGGNVGLGTSSPVVELQVTDGDTPTLRLEQNGASGWTPQIWDVGGNETNFFVRDVTNGSKLSFKIKPGAPDNSIFIAADGDIGLGTANPSEALHVQSGNVKVQDGNLTLDNGNLTVSAGNLLVPGGNLNVGGAFSIASGGSVFGSNFSVFATDFFTSNLMGERILDVDNANKRVGLGLGLGVRPAHLLELGADDAVKPGGGDWSAPSDRRLKTNIRPFTDGLNIVSQINPVVYNYNGKMNLPTNQDFIGVIAQDVKPVADYMIKPLNKEGDNDYLTFDPSSINFILINAVQEQQAMIEAQQSEIDALKAQLSMVNELNEKLASLASKVDQLSVENSKQGKTKVSED